MNPSSKEDWESFADLIYAELIKKQSSKPGFEKHFVSHMYKNIASTLRDVDIRKSSTMLKAYAEDKAKAEKEAKKSGGQKKVAAAKPKAVGTASAKNVYVARFSACMACLTYSPLSALISCHSSHTHTCQCLYSIDTRACKCLPDVAVPHHPGTNPDFSLRVITIRQTATRHSTTTSTSCKALRHCNATLAFSSTSLPSRAASTGAPPVSENVCPDHTDAGSALLHQLLTRDETRAFSLWSSRS
jgi:hypothetical protein